MGICGKIRPGSGLPLGHRIFVSVKICLSTPIFARILSTAGEELAKTSPQTIQIAASLVAESFDQPLKMKNLRMA